MIFEANILNRWGTKSAAARALSCSRQTIDNACKRKRGLSDEFIRQRLDAGTVSPWDIIAAMEGVRKLSADNQRRLRDATTG